MAALSSPAPSAVSATEAGRMVVILNPAAGSAGETSEVMAQIRAVLPEVELRSGDQPGDAERQAGEAVRAGFEVIVAAGGDGTLNEVVNGLLAAGGGPKLGLLPLGTGNDFARTLGLPFALEEALEVLRAGHTRALDVAQVRGARERWMINVSAGGFAGIVDEKLTPEVKATWGPLSYLRGMIEALGEMQVYRATLWVDDGPPQELELLNLVVANAGYVARGVPIAPAADPGDGLLDLVAIRESTVGQLALLAPAVLAGAHLEHESVLHLRGRRFHICSVPPMIFNTDGEVLGEGDVTFEVRPAAVQFLVPPPAR